MPTTPETPPGFSRAVPPPSTVSKVEATLDEPTPPAPQSRKKWSLGQKLGLGALAGIAITGAIGTYSKDIQSWLDSKQTSEDAIPSADTATAPATEVAATTAEVTAPTTVEVAAPTTVEVAAPAAPTIPEGWVMAETVFSTGTASQKEAAVKGTTPSSCAAYTFECKDGTFVASSDQFVNVTGCPKPLIDWTGWTPGTKVTVGTESGQVYEKGMTAPMDLCAQIPEVTGRVIHYLPRVK